MTGEGLLSLSRLLWFLQCNYVVINLTMHVPTSTEKHCSSIYCMHCSVKWKSWNHTVLFEYEHGRLTKTEKSTNSDPITKLPIFRKWNEKVKKSKFKIKSSAWRCSAALRYIQQIAEQPEVATKLHSWTSFLLLPRKSLQLINLRFLWCEGSKRWLRSCQIIVNSNNINQ